MTDFIELPFFDPDTEDLYIIEVSVTNESETCYWETGRHTADAYSYTIESCILEDKHVSLPDWVDRYMIEEAIEDCIG